VQIVGLAVKVDTSSISGCAVDAKSGVAVHEQRFLRKCRTQVKHENTNTKSVARRDGRARKGREIRHGGLRG
jgi:hypothetical protein